MKQNGKIKVSLLIFMILILGFSVQVKADYQLPTIEKSIEIPSNLKKVVNRLPTKYLSTFGRTLNYFHLKDSLKLNVKNQQDKNICWACSSNSAYETTVNRQNGSNYLFDDDQLDQKVNQAYGKTTEAGGNIFMAYGYYTAGNSPVTVGGQTTNLEIDEYTLFPTIFKSVVDGKIQYKDNHPLLQGNTYTEEEVKLVRSQIKQHIQNYGAVTAAMYASDMRYYNDTLTAFYSDSSLVSPDHQVTIVGWDDNYAVENFNEAHRPTEPGAYIVMNSHGTDVYDKGFLYISYQDNFIESVCSGIKKTSTKEQTQLYQYDELGINTAVGFKVDAYGANVFTRNNPSQEEYLTEVNLSTLAAGQFEIYVNAQDGELSLDKLKKVKTITTENAGFSTITLSTPIKLTGQKFVVAIKSIKGDALAQIGLENNDGVFWKNATAQKGQSYLSLDGAEWEDLKDLEADLGNQDANICLKAKTTTNNSQTEILGDINGDGTLDLLDLSVLIAHLGNWEGKVLTGEKLQAADITKDGEVDTRDLSKLILLLAQG